MNHRKLRIRRIFQGLSQAELGRRIGKSMGWVSLIERGYLRLAPAMVTAIQEALSKPTPGEGPARHRGSNEGEG